jgi:hypothetical protein
VLRGRPGATGCRSAQTAVNSVKACEKTGKNRQKGRTIGRPALPKPPHRATFVIRQSRIPKNTQAAFGQGQAQTEIGISMRLS